MQQAGFGKQRNNKWFLATRKRDIISIASLVTLFIAYAIVSNSGRVNATLFPPPQAVVSAAIALFAEENLSIDILTSLGRVLTGYTIGVTLAILLGALMGWFWLVDAVFDPIVELIRPVPPLAYIPLMILWFGIDETPKIMVITLGCFVTALSTSSQESRTPHWYIEAARTMGAGARTLLHCAIPPPCHS